MAWHPRAGQQQQGSRALTALIKGSPPAVPTAPGLKAMKCDWPHHGSTGEEGVYGYTLGVGIRYDMIPLS